MAQVLVRALRRVQQALLMGSEQREVGHKRRDGAQELRTRVNRVESGAEERRTGSVL